MHFNKNTDLYSAFPDAKKRFTKAAETKHDKKTQSSGKTFFFTFHCHHVFANSYIPYMSLKIN